MHDDQTLSNRSTEGMVDYDAHSSAQQSMVATHAATIRELVRNIGPVRPEFRIADYGCGPGISTINVARPAIEAYRELDGDGPIAVCHADQPGNDWNALFTLLSGPEGYLQGRTGIRPEAAVGSFYDRLVSDESVDLATCFAASHWLSHAVRLDAPGAVWFADLQEAARRQMAALARDDWVCFLRLRAQELRPGGHLLVSTLGSVPDAGEANGAAASGRGIYRAIQVAAQSMADEGLFDRAILDRFVFALWFQTEDDARGPIGSDPVLSKAFDIERVSVGPAPANADDVFGALIGDPPAYARQYTGYMRAFADTTLRTHLFGPAAKNDDDADALAKEFYRRFEALYREHPGQYKFELWELTVILRKRF
jgi:SAM-dependent methyltransferase